MGEIENLSVKVKNFKCFGDEPQGFESIKPVNIIIGRNNSGKSSLLLLFKHLLQNEIKFSENLNHNSITPEIFLKSKLEENEVKNVFSESTRGGDVPGHNHWEFGKQFVGTELTWRLNHNHDHQFLDIGTCNNGTKPFDLFPSLKRYQQQLANHISNPLRQLAFKHISAERDIIPESDKVKNYVVECNGNGITNLIQNYLNKDYLPRKIIEEDLLLELNKILNPDIQIEKIVCELLADNRWEIKLFEKSKGYIALSQSGSGLKTIIHVLVNLFLVPKVESNDLSKYIFGFEELENNLHPALLRRLLSYIYNTAINEKCTFILTTHSSVEIDQFSKSPEAQIIHIQHNGTSAQCHCVKTYIENSGILDDLDIRASDMLQSNGIIWVEGPSDRTYINRWIDLFSDGILKEGFHYQCVFYGGKLLAHLNYDDPEMINESISLLNINRNSIILMDSDKKAKNSKLKKTVIRLRDEFNKKGAFCWITRGREIENYVSQEVIKKCFNVEDTIQLDKYDNFFDVLFKTKNTNFQNKKTLLASKLVPHFEKSDLSVLDLNQQLFEVCNRIKIWNNISD